MTSTHTNPDVSQGQPGPTAPSTARSLAAGLVAGLVQPLASLLVAVPPVALELHHVDGPLLYGAVGIHLLYAALFGLGFGLLLARSDLPRRRAAPTVAAGLAYGLALWLVAVAVAWPVALRAFGTPAAPPLPYLHPHPLVGHAVYGLALGLTARVLHLGGDGDASGSWPG